MSESSRTVLAPTALPDIPFPGIEPYGYGDRKVFFGREKEARDLIQLIVIYRGVLLFSDSGSGKSSLINAGLIPLAIQEGYQPEKIRVQPKKSKEIVIERIIERTGNGSRALPSVFPFDENAERKILSVSRFLEILRTKGPAHRSLLIFDQFEEWITLFEEGATGSVADDVHQAQAKILGAIVTLLRETTLSVKVLISLREDYLAKLTPLFEQYPQLPDQYLRLTSPKVTQIADLIHKPFEEYPGEYAREIDSALAEEIQKDFAKKVTSSAVRLTEVQIVCQSLFESGVSTENLLIFFQEQKRVEGVLISYLERALHSLTAELREPAVCLLGRMVTSVGTRNVIQEDDLLSRVESEQSFSKSLLKRALESLESKTKLVRREPRQNVYYYEITSEFLIGWIQTKFQEQQQRVEQERRERTQSLEQERRAQQERQQRAKAEAEAEAQRLRAEKVQALADAERSRLIAQAAEALAEAEKRRATEQTRQTKSFRRLAWVLAVVLLMAITAAVFAFNRQQVAVRARTIAETAGDLAKKDRLAAEEERKRADKQALLARSREQEADEARTAAETARMLAEHARSQAVAEKKETDRVNGLLQDVTAKALTQKREAQKAQAEAETLSLVSRSRELAAAAVANLSTDTERSVLLALRAMSVTDTGEAEDALHQAVPALREKRTLAGHTGIVWGVAFSPDGNRLATVSEDNTAKVWDLISGRELLALSGHTGGIEGVAFSPDGKRLATASQDKTAKVWDAHSGKQLYTLTDHKGSVVGVAFSLDGKFVATASKDKTAKLWDADAGKLLRTLSLDAVATHIAFSPESKRLATSGNKTAKVWDVTSGTELLTLPGHTDRVDWVAFNPKGDRLATASRDKTAKVWNADSGKELLTMSGHTDWVTSVAFSSDGKFLATSSFDGSAKVWDALAVGGALYTLSGHAAGIEQVTFSPDDRYLATASGDNTAKLWDASPSVGELRTFSPKAGELMGIALGVDGTRLAASSSNAGIVILDAISGNLLNTIPEGNNYLGITFSPDGGLLAAASISNSAKLWNTRTLKLLTSFSGHEGMVWRVAFSPDAKLLATASWDKTTKIWDVASGAQLMTLSGHEGAVYGVAFSPDGKKVATASQDKTAKIWDVATGLELHTLKGHADALFNVSFSPDGKRLATASRDRTAKVWDAGSGKELFTLSGHISSVFDVAFNPEGTRLATASFDRTARVWDISPGQQGSKVFGLYGHTDAVIGVAFTRDGKRLFTTSEDGVIREFALDVQDLIALARKRVTRSLTAEECNKYLHTIICPPSP